MGRPFTMVRMVKPLQFADIVKERAFSWASIVRVKNTFGVKWGYKDESRPLIGCILSLDQTTLCLRKRTTQECVGSC